VPVYCAELQSDPSCLATFHRVDVVRPRGWLARFAISLDESAAVGTNAIPDLANEPKDVVLKARAGVPSPH
jgi:hypothetical protein